MENTESTESIAESTDDPHSLAIPEPASIKEIKLELTVDFEQKVLTGKAILTIFRKSSTNEIILDILGLVVICVREHVLQTLLYHNVVKDILGNRLFVRLPRAADPSLPICMIDIHYETSPKSRALKWLKPKQTADGEHPFLLSTNKLTFARSWFPCQDTPAVKFMYSAEISVPKNFTVLTSAVLQEVYRRNPKLDVYKFYRTEDIPSYIVTIAVGSLKKRKVNENLDIFAESKFIDICFDAVRENINTIEYMIQTARSVCGPYYWGRYDICVLPPSIGDFAFYNNIIECPCVIFISPTLVYGDFACVKVLARKISHSWAGSSVTCVNYSNMWLNESFRMFIAGKIICKLLFYQEMDSYLRRRALIALYNSQNETKNKLLQKQLLPNLKKFLKPYDVTFYVPYEMGYIILDHLQNILGGPTVFEPFLKSYFNKFALKSINTKDWENYLYQYFSDKEKILNNDISWKAWLYDVVPPITVPELTEWQTKCLNLAKEWVDWNYDTHNIPPISILSILQTNDGINITHFDAPEIMMFLTFLQGYVGRLTTEKLRLILHHFNHVFEIHNNEIRFLWLELCIQVRWTEKVKPALNFAIQFCSPNYTRPIFRNLYEWLEMRPTAIQTYISNKKKMLRKTRKQLDEILHLNL